MTLKKKLTILFTAFTLLALTLFGAIVYYQARKTLETIRMTQLNGIADLKKNKIETFFAERTKDLRTAQKIPVIRKYLMMLARQAREEKGPSHTGMLAELDSELKPFETGYAYLDVMLVDVYGRIVYISNQRYQRVQLGTLLTDKSIFEEGKDKIYYTDVFAKEADGRSYEMLGVAPVSDMNGGFIGEIVIEIDMEPIYRFIQDNIGLGETGESLICKRDGKEVLFLSPLRHDSSAALKKRLPFGNKVALAAQRAAEGENGSGVAYDYWGDQVLAAWRYIPFLRWGLVTKIDASEAFAPVAHDTNYFLAVGLALLIAGILVSIAISNAVTRPLLALQRGAEAIAAGDLNQKVGTGTRDEIG